MKSYFIGEVGSLKTETAISKKQGLNINIQETTILKNKIKLIGPENKLLNRQNF